MKSFNYEQQGAYCIYKNLLTNVKNFDFVFCMIYPKIIPAIVADKSDAKDPPRTAFIPNSDKFFR